MSLNMEEELFLDEIRDVNLYSANPEIQAEAEMLLREMTGAIDKLLALNVLLVIYYEDKRYGYARREGITDFIMVVGGELGISLNCPL